MICFTISKRALCYIPYLLKLYRIQHIKHTCCLKLRIVNKLIYIIHTFLFNHSLTNMLLVVVFCVFNVLRLNSIWICNGKEHNLDWGRMPMMAYLEANVSHMRCICYRSRSNQHAQGCSLALNKWKFCKI